MNSPWMVIGEIRGHMGNSTYRDMRSNIVHLQYSKWSMWKDRGLEKLKSQLGQIMKVLTCHIVFNFDLLSGY